MMAGMAMASLPNTKGLDARAMLWAAFCMPTSIIMVRLSLVPSFMARDSRPPASIAREDKQQEHQSCPAYVVEYHAVMLDEEYGGKQHEAGECRFGQHPVDPDSGCRLPFPEGDAQDYGQ